MARPADRIDRRKRDAPLWAQVRADLLNRLDGGEFESGFPGELELVEQYAVSRHTIREALRELRSEGLVLGRRGRPSRLAAAEPVEIDQPLGALYSLFASVQAAGLDQHSEVRALDIRADGVVALHLGLEESTPLLYLERLRKAGDEPLAMDRVWLPAEIAGALVEVDFRHTALYEQLATRCDVRLTGGREQIRARTATHAEAKLLHLPAGDAVMSIERLGCRSGVPIEWRRTIIRGDRFAVSADFNARNGYRVELNAAATRSPR